MATHNTAAAPLAVKDIANSPDYSKFKENRLGVLLLTMLTGNEDPDHVGAEALVGGGNDKKIDAFFIDLEQHCAYIGQLYIADKWGKSGAPANKASDLNTATAWLLSVAGAKTLPKTLLDRAAELQRLLRSGEVQAIHLFYCHNCVESHPVKVELDTAQESMQKRLTAESLPSVSVTATEYGLTRLQSLIETDPNKQFVNVSKGIKASDSLYEDTASWDAVTTTVDGTWLKELHNAHGARLFRPNFRDYMGLSKRRRDINSGIKNTIEREPENFWIYNNGITILCDRLITKSGKYVASGLAVVNGAQTTGSFGEANNAEGARVLARFIRCKSKALVNKIIKYNNTQNEIRPSDTRANEHVQNKLKAEFEELELVYAMRRTGGKMQYGAILSSVVGVSLAAFHGDTQLAARNSADIFVDDETYGRVFRSDLTARHVVVVLALSSAIDKLKAYLKGRVDADQAAPTESQMYESLRYSMSKHFIMSLFGRLAPEIVGTKLPSLYRLELKKQDGNSMQSVESAWYEVLRLVLPFVGNQIASLGDPYDVTRDVAKVNTVASQCAPFISLARGTNSRPFTKLKGKIL